MAASGRRSRRMRSISSPVPTGTVDFVTTTAAPERTGAISRTASIDEAQIGVTVAAARRRAHRDEHGLGVGRALRFRGEFEPALAEVRFDEVGQAGLEDRNLAAVERGDAAGVPVDHRHLMTEIGKAGAGDEPDVAGPDHGHAHEKLRSSSQD